MPYDQDNTLADWKIYAKRFQQEIKNVIVGLEDAINLITVAVFACGHLLNMAFPLAKMKAGNRQRTECEAKA